MSCLVIKIGSNILASEDNGLDMQRIQALADDISSVQALGYEVVVVSSGAIAAGMKKLGLSERPKDIILKQAAAAVGQSSLMWAYEKCFALHKKTVAQILLTQEDFSDRKRYMNSKNTLSTLLSYGIIPVINENDTVATEEIRFGDNDNLAALVAGLIGAERLLILSDVEGFFTEDPRKNPEARLISFVDEITPEMEKRAGGTGTSVGTGGMTSKLKAAQIAISHGITVNILNGRRKGGIISLLKGDSCGTEFKAMKKPSRL